MVPIRAAPIPIGDGMRVRQKTRLLLTGLRDYDKEWMTHRSDAMQTTSSPLKAEMCHLCLERSPDISESDIRYQSRLRHPIPACSPTSDTSLSPTLTATAS